MEQWQRIKQAQEYDRNIETSYESYFVVLDPN